MKKIIKIIFIALAICGLFWVGYTWYFKDTNTPQNMSLSEKTDASIKIIAAGDSLTAGYGLPLSESYPMQLENKLRENGFDVEVINAGISGETTAGLLERVEFIKNQNPDMVLITIGGNDALRALPVANTEENIRGIVQSFKQILPAEKIFLMHTRSPLNAGIVYANTFNTIYEKITKEEKINLVPFVETEVFLNNSLMLDDRIHPNKAGYAFLIDEYIYKAVAKKLE